MTDPSNRTPEEELDHWRAQLAKALHAHPEMLWPNLIDWAAESEEWSQKTATRAGRAKIASVEQRLAETEAQAKQLTEERERLTNDLSVYQKEVRHLQDEMETAAYDRTWPHERTRPADVQREVDRAVGIERRTTNTVTMQFRAASERWRRQREDLEARLKAKEASA